MIKVYNAVLDRCGGIKSWDFSVYTHTHTCVLKSKDIFGIYNVHFLTMFSVSSNTK